MAPKLPRKRTELERSDIIDHLPAACLSEELAVEFLESNRWGDCPCCPHCGSVAVYKMLDRKTGERNARFLWRCKESLCGKQYTVRIGTVYEDSLVPLRKWVRAFWEATSAKNGVSARELQRKLQVSYPTALFMLNRIRHAMAKTGAFKLFGTLEADELYVGPKNRRVGDKRHLEKVPIVAVVQRGGEVRALVVPSVTSENLRKVLADYAKPGSPVMTDDFKPYRSALRGTHPHDWVRHSYGEHVDKDNPEVHTNTVEGFFSRIRRSLNGTYHSVSREHLHRYVSQAAFLYNTRYLNDGDRCVWLIRQAQGRRLMRKAPKA